MPRIAVTVDVLQLVDVKAAERQPSLCDPDQHSIGRFVFGRQPSRTADCEQEIAGFQHLRICYLKAAGFSFCGDQAEWAGRQNLGPEDPLLACKTAKLGHSILCDYLTSHCGELCAL